jgi:hypothetical protein
VPQKITLFWTFLSLLIVSLEYRHIHTKVWHVYCVVRHILSNCSRLGRKGSSFSKVIGCEVQGWGFIPDEQNFGLCPKSRWAQGSTQFPILWTVHAFSPEDVKWAKVFRICSWLLCSIHCQNYDAQALFTLMHVLLSMHIRKYQCNSHGMDFHQIELIWTEIW